MYKLPGEQVEEHKHMGIQTAGYEYAVTLLNQKGGAGPLPLGTL